MVVVVAGASAGVGCAITRRFRRSAAFLSVLVDRSAEHWPPGMDVAAGEQTYDPFYFQRMLDAGASMSSRRTQPAAAASSVFLSHAAATEKVGIDSSL